jgi:hypothetical protein
MSITVTTEPDDQHAAYTFVEFDTTTTRDDAYNQAVTNVAETTLIGSGRVKFIMSGTTSFEVDDIVTGSGFTDTRLNRNHRVLLASGNNVETSTTWNTDFAGDAGDLDKDNQNLQLRGDLRTISTASQSFVGVSDDGNGFAKFGGIGDTSGFEIGELMKVTGGTSYDGLHVITAKTVINLTTATAFGVTENGTVFETDLIASRRIDTPASGVFTFNFASMLQAILSFNVASLASTGITNTSPLAVKDYAVKFVEEYDDENGLQFESSEVASAEHEAHNITRQADEVESIDQYLMQNITKTFLTNQPAAITVGDTEHAQLHFVVDDSIGDVQYRVKKYDSSDAQIGATFVSAGFTLVNNRGIISVEASMWDAATAYIEVTLNTDPAGSVLGAAQRYNIDRRCYLHPVRFHWLNRAGGFDSYTFTADFEQEIVTGRSLFEKTRTSASTVEDRGLGSFNVKADRSFNIFSGFEPLSTRQWLEELITSPVVYYEAGTDLIPIVLTVKDHVIDVNGMVQMEVSYSHSNSLVIQHG